MKTAALWMVAAALTLAALAMQVARSWRDPDTSRPVLRFAVTDIEGLEQLQREFGAFRDLLEAHTGCHIELFPVANRTAAVEALRAGQLELVLTGPAEYVIFHSRTRAQPLVGLYRPNYHTVILVPKNSSVQKLDDLSGARIAMGAIGSTSKHLAPVHMLVAAGAQPREIVHTSVQAGWEALRRGDVDAFATTNDKYARFLAEDPFANQVRLLARSGELPMDVLLAHPQLPRELMLKVRAAIDRNADQLVEAILEGDDNQKYQGTSFRTEISDPDYDDVRRMYSSAGVDEFAVLTSAG